MTYTVDVAQAGDYRATLTYGTPVGSDDFGLVVFLDGRRIGRFRCLPHANTSWDVDMESVIDRLALPAGRHRLTVLAEGSFNCGTIVFAPRID